MQYELIERAYDAATRGGHSCQPIVMEVFGGFHPGAVKLVDQLARQSGKRLGRDHLSAPACARNFRSFHTHCSSVALHLAAAEEILDTIMIDRAAHVQMGGN